MSLPSGRRSPTLIVIADLLGGRRKRGGADNTQMTLPPAIERERVLEGEVLGPETEAERELRERLNFLAWLLDSSIPIPGTRFSVGLDAVIGLFPFIGDLIGVAASSDILAEANRMGAGKAILARMAFNVAIEGVIGILPLFGATFDAAWKA